MEVKLSAIDLLKVSNIPEYREDKIRNKAYVSYGDNNKWNYYLFGLYKDVATLNTLVNGCADYTAGNGVKDDYEVNSKGLLASELVRKLAFDRFLYGGFAFQVLRNYMGQVAEIYYIPFGNIRSNESNTEFWYSKDWSVWGAKAIKYPAFNDSPASIFYFKGYSDYTYPICPFNGAITSCEIERRINNFHLNEISNNFNGSAVINFNNGVPNDEQKAEIERLINSKFSGDDNAGRILIAYNDSKDNAVTIEKLAQDNLDDRYKDLAERSRDQIFTSFRATPSLFGLSTSTGFNAEEYKSQFEIFNRCVIRPVQLEIQKAFKRLGKELNIIPFTLQYD